MTIADKSEYYTQAEARERCRIKRRARRIALKHNAWAKTSDPVVVMGMLLHEIDRLEARLKEVGDET